ncbi:MAG: N-acetyltransferase [Thermodesulfobacteriota bacterium]
MDLTIRPMTQQDLSAVVEIHKGSYQEDHVTSRYSPRLLHELYRQVLTTNRYCFVACLRGQVAGFLLAGEHTRQAVNVFLWGNKLGLLATVLRHPSFLRSSVVGLMHRITAKEEPVVAVKILSIAVAANQQRRGIGQALLEHLEIQLRRDGVPAYGLFVKRSNTPAIAFYRRNAFLAARETDQSIYFEKQLDGPAPPTGV